MTTGTDSTALIDLKYSKAVPLSTIYYWTSRKEIPFLKVGRHVRFNLEKVLEFLEERTQYENLACNPLGNRIKTRFSRSLKTEETNPVP